MTDTNETISIAGSRVERGRFAPSPSGRMHLGNVAAALVSWLSVKSRGGRWVLRIEDLDPQRSKDEYARQIEDDLDWLGLTWDEGGLAATGPCAEYRQSRRSAKYAAALDRLNSLGLTYPCFCTRADIMATQAPHQSDGRVVYKGTCRPVRLGGNLSAIDTTHRAAATRLFIPDREIDFSDRLYGPQSVNLARHCGDFILRRADGAWAYQLAVVVDDAEMGITEVVRGHDLLTSSAQQIYLYELLGHKAPKFAHIPLVCNASGLRLSKRDGSLSLEVLRSRYTPEEVIGFAAHTLGLLTDYVPVTPADLLTVFSWDCLPPQPTAPVTSALNRHLSGR